ncbi:MAG: hypothetical protein Q9170_001564 [Blastenia crenularia]
MNISTTGPLLNIQDVGINLVYITRLYLDPKATYEAWLCQNSSRNGLGNMSACIDELQMLVKANECTLYWCVHRYVATVQVGRFTETYLDSWANHAPLNVSNIMGSALRAYDIVPTNEVWSDVMAEVNNESPYPHNLSTALAVSKQDTDSNAEPYSFQIELNSHIAVSGWLSSFFNTSVNSDEYVTASPATWGSEDPALFFRLSQGSSSNGSAPDKIPQIMSNMAWSLTQLVRRTLYRGNSHGYLEYQPSDNTIGIPANASATGTAFEKLNVVGVRWQWLILHTALVTMTAILTISTKTRTSRQSIPAWSLEGPVSITVKVGDGLGQGIWTLPKDLLTHASPFFVAALNHPWSESTTKQIELKEDTPDAFRCFLLWLLTSTLRQDGIVPVLMTKDPDPTLYTRAWILGDKLGCAEFQDFALAHIWHGLEKSRSDTFNVIQLAYANTPQNSKLRVFLAGYLLRWIVELKFAFSERSGWMNLVDETEDLATDVTKLQMRCAKPFKMEDNWSQFFHGLSWKNFLKG